MKTSEKGFEIIKRYEGCRLTAYRDPVGIPTIGYGHTFGVKMGQVITQAQADAYLRADVDAAERAVSRYYGAYHWNQNQFDALVSFTFNCGGGNLDKLLANGWRTVADISDKLPSYCKAGGKTLSGLVRRRAEEKALFDSAAGSQPATSAPSTQHPSFSVGDVVNFAGNKHYASAGSSAGKPCKPGRARVTQVYKPGISRHPYHLVAISGGGSDVYGWVDAADIQKNGDAAADKDINVGDIVTFSGRMHYNSSYPGAKGLSCAPGRARVTQINTGKSHPYHLVRVDKCCTVHGWVDEKDVKK